MKVYIPTGKAVSLKVVANTIGKVLARNQIIPIVVENFCPHFVLSNKIDGVIFNYPADPVWARGYAGYYLMFKSRFGDKLMFYTTIEGRPRPIEVREPIWKYIEFIANSNYTARKLLEAGLRVRDVVHHGIDFEEVRRAKIISSELRQRAEQMAGDKVKFGYVGSTHIRKNIKGLMEAVDILNNEGIDDFVLLMITENVETPPNVYKVADMGTKSHEQVLAFMDACDFIIFPTMCEGFGLPVLEAMAVGKIALHGWFEPLSEFSDRDTNITWDYVEIEDYEPMGPNRGGVIFEFHKFPPKFIASAMKEAIDLYRNNKDEYEDKCIKNKELAKRYDANITYKYFVDRLKS